MKNTFGQSLTVTLFGESHGAAVGAVVDGLAPGLPVSRGAIERQLSRRRPSDALATARREADHFEILNGVFNDRTTGTPLCLVIPNENTRSGDYQYGLARPSHADYAAYCKYHGFEDYRGGGHFSGRITAALVAVGGILLPALERCGIALGTHILRCGGIADRDFSDLSQDFSILCNASLPVLDAQRGEAMAEQILAAAQAGDSVGGVTQTAVAGLPAGLGEPWFDSVEGLLSHALFSLGGVKGVEFGAGFAVAEMRGSENNDPFYYDGDTVKTRTNHAGGILGGITNGMPLVFRAAVKPTPSIARVQDSVSLSQGVDTKLEIHGRHDPCIVPRAVPCVEAAAAIAVYDALLSQQAIQQKEK